MESAKSLQRILGGIIDLLAFICLVLLVFAILPHNSFVNSCNTFIDNFSFKNLYNLIIEFLINTSNKECFFLFVGLFISYALVYIAMPLITNGKTLGLMIFNVRIVKLSETRLSFGTMFLRQIIAGIIIPLLTLQLINILNIFLLLYSKGRRTIPDRMSNTLCVIDNREKNKVFL